MAEYKNLKKDNKNFSLMMAIGNTLSLWRENFNTDGEPLTVAAVAKAIGERYESVYRLEHGGGSSILLAKYLLYINKVDENFEFVKNVKERLDSKV